MKTRYNGGMTSTVTADRPLPSTLHVPAAQLLDCAADMPHSIVKDCGCAFRLSHAMPGGAEQQPGWTCAIEPCEEAAANFRRWHEQFDAESEHIAASLSDNSQTLAELERRAELWHAHAHPQKSHDMILKSAEGLEPFHIAYAQGKQPAEIQEIVEHWLWRSRWNFLAAAVPSDYVYGIKLGAAADLSVEICGYHTDIYGKPVAVEYGQEYYADSFKDFLLEKHLLHSQNPLARI